MSDAEALPAHPDLDWYKKSAKKRLDELRASNPAVKLAEAQLAVAREYGFPSWRKLKDRIDQLTDLPRLFVSIREDDRVKVRALLRAKPGLSRLAGPEGQTAIHVAAECNNPDAIQILLRNRGDPQAYFGGSAHNALSWSLTVGSMESANALVRNGIEPDFFVPREWAMWRSCGRSSIRTGTLYAMRPAQAVRAGPVERECRPRRRLTVNESQTLFTSRVAMVIQRLCRNCSLIPQIFRFARSSAGPPCTGHTSAAAVKWSRSCSARAPIQHRAMRSSVAYRKLSGFASPPVGVSCRFFSGSFKWTRRQSTFWKAAGHFSTRRREQATRESSVRCCLPEPIRQFEIRKAKQPWTWR
jgi:hypothetical protein